MASLNTPCSPTTESKGSPIADVQQMGAGQWAL